ncbi:piggyBac transposable element-derived protein 4-like protein [Lates japonicus]|uniref:PiggyBac transposable element-derived protein 4-like protein n=1 Tax=Lates japonicus TaxID=270547 RepID=A0AAD3MZF4_LATJO|nr:piggyBac transposable element-derived protein 4-like protein [Lates japonicus]
MAGRYTISEALDYISDDHHTDEEGRGQETDSEDGFEEEVSEAEDDTEYNPDQEISDEEESSDEEDGHSAAAVTFKSKNGNLSWSSSPPENQEPEMNLPAVYGMQSLVGQFFGSHHSRNFTLSRVIRFDNRDTRPGHRQHDKLAAIREVWDKWVEGLPRIYNPSPDVTVDERLVAFRGPFKQYMPSKPSKYGIKIWTTCDARTSYAWKMQVYTGKPADGVPEKNQGKRVVLKMTAGLKGHNIT